MVNSDEIAEALLNCILITSVDGDSSFPLDNFFHCLIDLSMSPVLFPVFVGLSLAVTCIC